LCDFGIAHISGAFTTATGFFTGTPAFMAPEVLSGEAPSASSDVYELGATLFAALTGHAAFERRRGEAVVAQFLRVASDPLPDLRDRGIPAEVGAVVEQAMCREPGERPTAWDLGTALQQLQAQRGTVIAAMAVPGSHGSDRPASPAVAGVLARRAGGGLPAPLASVVGRRGEVAELRALLATSRLVTVTGVGGIGKTTLAMYAARELSAGFPDGVWLVELADLRDESLLADVAAGALGLREQSARPRLEVLVEFLRPRQALLVLDNCEHLSATAAQFAQTLLRGCAGLHIVATSRHVLAVSGESVLALAPLRCPDQESDAPLAALADCDAVALFVQRARAAVTGFTLTERNAAVVARICTQLDGLPLALELAAARLRAMSLKQIADGLCDRYTLLTHGRRGAVARQQTLDGCVGWSYGLCTPAERQLWERLSVFAGTFDLPAARHVCGHDRRESDFLDELFALVDKSILIREEQDDAVRFRLLVTLREYGKAHAADRTDYRLLARRHADWYQQLVEDAAAEWFSPHQIDWIARLTVEMPNLREALQFTLIDNPTTCLQMATRLRPIWMTRSMLGEARSWLDQALAATPVQPTPDRIQALSEAAVICAILQGDPAAARSRIAEARKHLEAVPQPELRSLVDAVDGYVAMNARDPAAASDYLERALADADNPETQVGATLFLGMVRDMTNHHDEAVRLFEKALALTASHGESTWRSRVLVALGVARWRDEAYSAELMMREGLRLCHAVAQPRTGALCLEVLAWIAESNGDPRRATMLMAAASTLASTLDLAGKDLWRVPYDRGGVHDECQRNAREKLGAPRFEAAWREGSALSFDQAVDFALTASPVNHHTLAGPLDAGGPPDVPPAITIGPR
jgi:predicted ATPase